MSGSSSRSPRSVSSNRGVSASQSFNPAASRPFLNMLNPMNRAYQGYTQANQSLLEEDEDDHGGPDVDEDLESARSRVRGGSKKKGKRISWDAGASELNMFRPNIQQEDKIHEQDSSDDEVPQSFMIEATERKPAPASSKGKEPVRHKPTSSPGAAVKPTILPMHASFPKTPSQMGDEENGTQPDSAGYWNEQPRKQMRGLDAYERALWNWVNVYNLDAFLQEVYYYYQGKGIYSIALARGLNLLYVHSFLPEHDSLHYRTVGFVIGFSTFLLGCINYSQISHDTRLSNVIVGHCVARCVAHSHP
jgi:autophagy-related protein 9